MFTVSQLARSCGLSRSTVLYYESIGLVRPAKRSASNYRRYSEDDLRRFRQVCLYRSAGLKLRDIRTILMRPENDAAAVLQRRFAEIGAEIQQLREHQASIAKLLQANSSLGRSKVVSKQKWVSIMRASGFSESDMHRWHSEFERSAPEEHQEFLEFLHIPADEIRSIREGRLPSGSHNHS